jgi:uncharacterized membrane protein YdfJ with MMPL/SSD domain
VFVMLLTGLTFVPAAVLLAGRAAFWPSRLQRFGHAEQRRHSFWAWSTTKVLAHPVKTVLASTLVLMVLAIGLVNYRESYNFLTGFRVATDSKQGQDLLNAAFPPGELAPTTVLIDAPAPLAGRFADLDRVTGAIAAVPGVRTVTGPTRPTGQPVADV